MPGCEICGRRGEVHHWYTRGAYGLRALVKANVIWLCRFHHYEVHNIGRYTFARKYGYEARLEKAGEAVRGVNKSDSGNTLNNIQGDTTEHTDGDLHQRQR